MDRREVWAKEKRKDWVSRTNCERYEREMGEYAKNKDKEVVLDFLKGSKGITLDLPCGAGRFSKILTERGLKVVGADYNLRMLKTTKRRVKSSVVRCDAFHLPFKDSSFGSVLAMRLLFHYPNYKDILKEIRRVMKKGGFLVFDTLNKHSLRYYVQFPLNIYRQNIGTNLQFCTKEDVRSMLRGLKLEILETDSNFLLPGRSYQYLPIALVQLLEFLEEVLPKSFRGVRYWKVKKS